MPSRSTYARYNPSAGHTEETGEDVSVVVVVVVVAVAARVEGGFTPATMTVFQRGSILDRRL